MKIKVFLLLALALTLVFGAGWFTARASAKRQGIKIRIDDGYIDSVRAEELNDPTMEEVLVSYEGDERVFTFEEFLSALKMKD